MMDSGLLHGLEVGHQAPRDTHARTVNDLFSHGQETNGPSMPITDRRAFQ